MRTRASGETDPDCISRSAADIDGMTSDEESVSVPVVCPVCDTTTTVELSGVAEAVERHNERLHDGEDVASVDPELRERIADLAAEDMQLLE